MKSLFTSLRHVAFGAALLLAGTAPAATILRIYDTGVDAAGHALGGGNGTTDSHYQIVGGTSRAAIVGRQAKTFDEFGYFMPDTAGSRAINATGNGTGDDNSTIVFRTTFDLTGYAPGSAMLSGTAQADDAATIELNGHPFTTMPIGYFAATPFASINPSFFVAGINVLDFIVRNGSGNTALRVANLRLTDTRTADAVPEPRTWALLTIGFGLVGIAARRRRPAASPADQAVSASTSARTFA